MGYIQKNCFYDKSLLLYNYFNTIECNLFRVYPALPLQNLWHKCASKLTIISSDNGLSPGWHQATIWTNVGILLVRTLGTNLGDILSNIHIGSFKKMNFKMSSAKWRQFCLCLNEWMDLVSTLTSSYPRAPPQLSPFHCHNSAVTEKVCYKKVYELTYLTLDKMTAISPTILWDAFSCMKSFVFW